MSFRIDRLEAYLLVRRAPDQSDARNVIGHVSEPGKPLVDRLLPTLSRMKRVSSAR